MSRMAFLTFIILATTFFLSAEEEKEIPKYLKAYYIKANENVSHKISGDFTTLNYSRGTNDYEIIFYKEKAVKKTFRGCFSDGVSFNTMSPELEKKYAETLKDATKETK
jgi:hypothetical protein